MSDPSFRSNGRLAGISLNEEFGTAKRGDRPLRIGSGEFKILQMLVRDPNRVFQREEIFSRVWPDNDAVNLCTVDQKIHRLRCALRMYGAPDPIVSVRGVGYRISDNCDEEYEMWLAQLSHKHSRRSS